MRQDIIDILYSWSIPESSVNSTDELLCWIEKMNREVYVNIEPTELGNDGFWYFNRDTGYIENRAHKFFSIGGLQYFEGGLLKSEQPVIHQPEIGYLGIICKKIEGIMHFLMQAKIEPGNVNCVQISPTIQATKSNFEQVHGGREPNYLSYFKNARKYEIILDQVQSEQGSRFFKKRNRNILIRVDEEIEILPQFRWMTLGQIKTLMEVDNLVNMDARTVLSCIPYAGYKMNCDARKEIQYFFERPALYRSMIEADPVENIAKVYNYINNIRMFAETDIRLTGLNDLRSWNVTSSGVFCNGQANFDIKYFDIHISGREVQHWTQPLLCASGKGIFGLMYCIHDGIMKFLVKVKRETGIFDYAEIGPTIFKESTENSLTDDIERIFFERADNRSGLILDCLFSEEGGRFYHEENRNIIVRCDYIRENELPPGYFWLSYASLSTLVQVNNCLNIQLRNLLSAIKG